MSASIEVDTFAFNPPEGTAFERTSTFRSEVAVPDTEFGQVEERIVTVDAKLRRDDDGNIHLEHTYKTLTFRLSGVINAEVSGPVRGVKLEGIIAPQEGLIEVRGLESLQAALLELAGPEQAEELASYFSLEYLKLYFLGRYDTMVGDLVGRPSAPGSTWEIELVGDPLVSRRTLKVEREETCPAGSCRRISATYGVNAEAVSAMAHDLFSGLAVDGGGQIQEIRVVSSEFEANDSVLVDPRAGLYYGAEFAEEGRAQLALGGEQQEIVIRRSQTMTYRYK